MKRWINLLAFILLFALAYSHNAQAMEIESECDRSVTDHARVLNNLFNVSTAMIELGNTGADPRVVVVPTLGKAKTLDQLENTMEQKCTWQSTNGTRKNNLVLLIVTAKEHGIYRMGLYCGSRYKFLDTYWPDIATKIIAPKLRNGDYDGALINALHKITRVTQMALHPELITSRATQLAMEPPPTNIMKSGLALCIILEVIFLTSWGIVWLSKRRMRIQKARLAAQTVRQQCIAFIPKLDELVRVTAKRVHAVTPTLSDEDVLPFHLLLLELSQNYDNAITRFGTLEHTAGNPNRAGLTAEEYTSSAAQYQEILDELHQIPKIIMRIDGAIHKLDTIFKELEVSKKFFAETVSVLEAKKKLLNEMKYEFGPVAIQDLFKAVLESVQNLATIETLISGAEQCFNSKQRAVKTGLALLAQITPRIAKIRGVCRAIDTRNAQLVSKPEANV